MLTRVRRWLLPAVVAVSVLPLSACSSGRAEKCEAAFKAVATSVDGVASAEWDCSFQFGGGWQRGDVVIEATTEDEAVAVMERLLRAFAASPDLDDRYESTTASHPADTTDRVLGHCRLGAHSYAVPAW
jgi:hypothetical protein